MKIPYCTLWIICLMWTACNNNSSLKNIPVSFAYVHEISIERPGFFVLSEDLLYLSDLKSKDTMIQVYNKGDAVRIGTLSAYESKIVTHQISSALDGGVIISDLSTANWGIYDIKRPNAWSGLGVNSYPKSAICQVASDKYIFLRPTVNDKPFVIFDSAQRQLASFGHFHLMDSLSFTNMEEVFLGEMTYSPDSLYFLYRGCNLPLLQLYRQEGNFFHLIAEKEVFPYQCTEQNQLLHIQTDSANHIIKASFTKDYIVLLNEHLPSSEKDKHSVQRRFQLIILNKQLEQIGVDDLPHYVYNIASDSKSNDVYLVYKENQSFYLSKISSLQK